MVIYQTDFQKESEATALASDPLIFEFLSTALNDPSNSLDQQISLAKLIAELAKVDTTRSTFNDIPCLIQLLEKGIDIASEDLIINLLRSLANLCYDYDDNRDKIYNIPGSIDIILKSFSINSKIKTIAFHAILNISMDNELVQAALITGGVLNQIQIAIQPLETQIMTSETNDSIIGLKVLSSVLESDKGLDELFKILQSTSASMKLMNEHFKSTEIEDAEYDFIIEYMDAVSVVLETISENNPAQDLIYSVKLMDHMIDFINIWPDYVPMEQSEINLKTVKIAISKIITTVTHSDYIMIEVLKHPSTVSHFINWMEAKDVPSDADLDDDVRMTGALCIGNLARSDESCYKLVYDHHIVSPLVKLLKVESERLKSDSIERTESKHLIRVLHAVIGAFKNLSLAEKVRSEVGELETINTIVSLFELDHLKLIYVACIGIIRNLCAGDNDINLYRILSGTNPDQSDLAQMTQFDPNTTSPVGKIIRLVWNVNDDHDGGIRTEGGRVIVNIIKAIHKRKALQFLPLLFSLNSITLVLQTLTGAVLTRSTTSPVTDFDSDNQVHFDAEPEAARVFPTIQNESIVALTLLCSSKFLK
ncbi:armadillo-type protein [Globomyces pollinis-pini]|nr:armadillo-type protein [Globomyces pollinis-pini]